MDMFGRDSDTTSDGEGDVDINIGAQDVQPATEAVESPAPPPPAVGRALFARAVSSDDTDTGDALGGGGETKGEDPPPPPPNPPPPSSAARPVKTIPRPVFEGDKKALIKVCKSRGSGDLDEARDLIAQGINIDEQDVYGQTALMNAVQLNRLEIVMELIRAGAALDLQNKYGNTVIMWAVKCNDLEIVQELIRAGAALDVQNYLQGMTALQTARKYNLPEIATLLREAGARCPGYERSGWFNSTCKRCWGSKAGRWHDEA